MATLLFSLLFCKSEAFLQYRSVKTFNDLKMAHEAIHNTDTSLSFCEHLPLPAIFTVCPTTAASTLVFEDTIPALTIGRTWCDFRLELFFFFFLQTSACILSSSGLYSKIASYDRNFPDDPLQNKIVSLAHLQKFLSLFLSFIT